MYLLRFANAKKSTVLPVDHFAEQEPDDSDDEFEMMDEPLGAESMEAEAAPGVAPGREASPVTPSRHHDAAHIANDYSRDRISTSTAANDGDGLGDDDSDDEASDDKAAKLHNTGPPPLSDEDTERLFIQSAQKTHDGSPNPSLDPRGHARPGKGDEHRHPARRRMPRWVEASRPAGSQRSRSGSCLTLPP